MLTLAQIMAIESKVSELPNLIDDFESRNGLFYNNAVSWLHSIEKTLIQNRISHASEISLLRAELALSARNRNGKSRHGAERKMSKSERDVVTTNIIRKAGEIVHEVIRKPKNLLEEGENIARQIASVAARKGLVAGMDGSWDNATKIWDKVFSDPELLSATTHLLGLVGRINAIAVFSKAAAEI